MNFTIILIIIGIIGGFIFGCIDGGDLFLGFLGSFAGFLFAVLISMIVCGLVIPIAADAVGATHSIEKVVCTLMPDLKFKNITQLFWEGDFMNDCYKCLWFRDGEYPVCDEITEYQAKNCSAEELAEFESANRIRDFLFTYLPEDYPYDYILVDVSW